MEIEISCSNLVHRLPGQLWCFEFLSNSRPLLIHWGALLRGREERRTTRMSTAEFQYEQRTDALV